MANRRVCLFRRSVEVQAHCEVVKGKVTILKR